MTEESKEQHSRRFSRLNSILRRPEFVAGFTIFITLAVLFAILHTQQFLAVDGALRCLSVYWSKRPMSGGNNHLLYFVNVFAWMKWLSLLGIRANDPFDFIHLAQLMNAVAAAGSVALLWLLCCHASRSFASAFLAAAAYAFSNAFLIHATSTAEPMVGIFWSMLSVAVVASGLAVSSRPRLFVGGILLLLAMATYESMVLIGPAELVLIWNWDERDTVRHREFAMWFVAGCGLGALLTYAPAYAMSGTHTPFAMLRRFLAPGGGSRVFGGFTISKLVNLPVGFANSMMRSLPAGYQGVRWLLNTHSHDRWILLTPAILLVIAGWVAWTGTRLTSVWTGLEYRQRLILVCAAIALAFDTSALIFWDPLYDKLWLQPLAVVFLAWSVILSAWRQPGQSAMMLVLEPLLVIAIFVTGVTSAFQASRSPTPCLGVAKELSRNLRHSDLLVTEWDPVSQLYVAFWGDGAKRLDIAATASDLGPGTVALLDDEVAKTKSWGGRVYFLGLLDLPEALWTPFLANRCHLPYRSLDRIRSCANPVAKLACSDGHEILWQLSFDCYKPRSISGKSRRGGRNVSPLFRRASALARHN